MHSLRGLTVRGPPVESGSVEIRYSVTRQSVFIDTNKVWSICGEHEITSVTQVVRINKKFLNFPRPVCATEYVH